jgi:ABC-type oligopeptide transport system substrate-binding subunit
VIALLFSLAAQEAEVLRVSWEPPASIDPAYVSTDAESRYVLALFEGLTTLGPDGVTVRPGAAERWESSPDGRVWTFRLKESRWSDGEPVVAADFVYAWRRLLRVGSPSAGLLRGLKGVEAWRPDPEETEPGFEATGPRTLKVTATRRSPWLPHLLAQHAFVPVPERALRKHGREWTRAGSIVTNGPFRFEGATLAEFSLRRVGPGTPARVAVGLHSPEVAAERYRAGVFAFLGGEQLPGSGEFPGRVDFDLWGTYFLRLNPAKAPLDRPEVRRALAAGLDRGALATGTAPRSGLVPPGFPGYPAAKGIGFDRAASLEGLLKESGFEVGKLGTMDLVVPDGPGVAVLAGRLREQIEEGLGWAVRMRVMKGPAYGRALAEGDFGAALAGWMGDYYDPLAFLEPWGGVAALEASEEADPARRLARLSEVEERLLGEATLIPLVGARGSWAATPRLRGLTPNPFGRIDLSALRAE